MADIVVPDANIFLEIIYGRSLQDVARRLLADAITNKVQMVTPTIVLDEITEVLCGNLDDFEKVRQHLLFLDRLVKEHILLLLVPNTAVRMKAIEIARAGNAKSGYPQLSDALYHATAILNQGTFITNDKRYVAKVRGWGHVMKLTDYALMGA